MTEPDSRETDRMTPRLNTIIKVTMALSVDLTLIPLDNANHHETTATTILIQGENPKTPNHHAAAPCLLNYF